METSVRRLVAAAVVVMALSPAALAQSVTSICDAYARDAVMFQKQNLEASCGLAGPEWNADYLYHYNWCVNGQNYQTATHWTAWRRDRIAQCRTSKAAPQPAVQPLQPTQTTKPVTPAQPPASGSDWAKRIGPITDDVVARLNRGIEAVRSRYLGQPRRATVTPSDVAAILSATQPRQLSDQYHAFQQTNRSIFDAAKVVPRNLHLPPKIDSVLSTPVNGRVEPGSALLITGSNFGNQPGRLYLTYLTQRETPGTEFRAQETVREVVELQPFRATWTQSWFSNVVMAKAPITFIDPMLRTDRPGQLQLVLSDGSTATAAVTVGGGFPEIRSVQTKSGVGWIKPGEEFTVLGRLFGKDPGRVRLMAESADNRRWQLIRGTNHYVYWPAPGSAPSNVWAADINLTIEGWSDTQIKLRAGDYDPLKYFAYAGATLQIGNAAGRTALYNGLGFGPVHNIKVVSGIGWLNKSARNAAKVTSNGGALVVTHTPTCGIVDSGEKGTDYFFWDVPWPQDVEVIGFDFQKIGPGNPYGDVDFFVDRLGDIVNAAASGPFGVLKYVGGKILDAIFGGGGGGYHVYVQSAPGGYGWDNKPHIIGIDWETDCALGGNPVMYAVSFTIAGTDAALARY